jgi:hypothetical protein
MNRFKFKGVKVIQNHSYDMKMAHHHNKCMYQIINQDDTNISKKH